MFKKPGARAIVTVGLFILLALSSGCTDQQDAPPEAAVSSQQTFVMGLIPEQDLFSQKQRYKALAQYISEKAGITVKLKILSRYGNIIENFMSSELDGAFFGSFTGALAISRIGVQPLARPLWLDGTSTYYGLVFARKDSAIKDADDMKGKRFAFVDRATTAGWLLPLHYFQEVGIGDYRTWFAETYFTGTHEDVIYDVLARRADIGAAKNTIFYKLAKNDPRILEQLHILTRSPDVPSNTLAVKSDLDNSLKLRLQNILLQMDQDKQGKAILHDFGAKKFIATTPKDYEPVFIYADEVKLNIRKYTYNNN